MTKKHPIYGYLSHDEFIRMMEGTPAERDYLMKKAREREQQAKSGRRK